jgi:hypothetical protein
VSTDFPGHRRDDLPGDVPGGLPGDLLGDIASSEPGLGALLGMLAADATPDELTGENAALAMFRANSQPGVPAPSPAEPDFGVGEFDTDEFDAGRARAFQPLAFGPPETEPGLLGAPGASGPRAGGRSAPGGRHPRRQARRVGLMAAAVTLAAAAGFAVAAYTEALPAPLQQAAFHALGFAGVPASHHPAPSAASSRAPGNARGHGSPHKPAPSTSASPQPSSSGTVPLAGQASLSITVTSGRIVAGRSDTFTAQLSDKSGGVAGASVSLLEREAGQTAWQLAGTATTGGNGTAALTASDLTANAAFRLKGPEGTLSRPVLVIVIPPVSASLSGSNGKTGGITASSPLAAPGNIVVLQILSGRHWMSLQMARLNGANQAQFMVRSRPRQRRYRVVLAPTASHGLSVSNAVMVPPR